MSLRECIASHTTREKNTWLQYLDDQWNQPSLTDLYLMQIAQVVTQCNVKDPKQIKLDDFLLKFNDRVEEKKPEKGSLEWKQRIAAAKAKWISAVGKGMRIIHKTKPPD